MFVRSHKLYVREGEPVRFVESPSRSGALDHRYLVMHYTAGANAESSIRTLTDPERRASAHLVISRSGDVTQLVPFDVVAWHAGPSRWAGLTNLNRYSIGIELDNAGKLTRNGSDWVSEFQRAYPAEEVIEARHKNRTEIRGWHRYTEQQLTVAIQVGGLLVREYGLRDVLGHDDIAPERKTDPGPAFPMASFRSAVLGRADDAPDPDRFTTTTDLNIRTGPGTQHEILKGSPVPPGTTVHILAREGNWARVDVEGAVNGVNDLEGWAHSKYLTPA